MNCHFAMAKMEQKTQKNNFVSAWVSNSYKFDFCINWGSTPNLSGYWSVRYMDLTIWTSEAYNYKGGPPISGNSPPESRTVPEIFFLKFLLYNFLITNQLQTPFF